MEVVCSICNKTYANRYSLAAHKRRYHKGKGKNAINIKKRYLNNELLSDESETENERYIKRTKSDNSMLNDSSSINKSLTNYTKRLPKLVRIVGDILEDVKELKEAVSDNRSSVEEVKDMEKQNFDLNSDMIGHGKKDENRLNEIGDDIDHLFLLVTELEGSKIRKMSDYGIESMEKAFDNTLEMIELFQKNMYRDIKFKINKLRNAALVTLKILKKSNELGKDNKKLLQKLSNASIFEAKDLLKNNIESLKSIFALLPEEEELVQTVNIIKDSELGDKNESSSSSSENDISENEVEEQESDKEIKESEYGNKDENDSSENDSSENENEEQESVKSVSGNSKTDTNEDDFLFYYY